MKFLERTAKYIAEHYRENTGDLYVVLPNRRAGLFLKRHLSSEMGSTFWAPEIFSIQDFIFKLAEVEIADQLDLTFTLYALHKSKEADKAQPLNEFLKWGTTMLNDFNDVDLYLADAENLFTYLTEAKAVARWNPDGRPLTEFEKDYLKFYSAMGGYYSGLKELLLKRNLAYPGMAYRMLAGNISKGKPSLAGKKIVFAGLNALTPAEEAIVQYFVTEEKADILWDADEYYLADKKQEAGRFLRKYLSKWKLPEFNWVSNSFADESRKVSITGIPGNVSQARYAGALLKDYLDRDPACAGKIAVVLADEKLLVPVLNSLPSGITKFNITMGYPLKDTPVFSFAEAVFSIHVNALKFNKHAADGSLCFYAHDLIRLLNHPYLQLLCSIPGDDGPPVSRKVADALTLNNSVFVSLSGMAHEFEQIAEGRFATVAPLLKLKHEDPLSLLYTLTEVLKTLRDIISADDRDRVELEFIFSFTGILNKLSTLFESNPEAVDIKTLQAFLVQLAKGQTIPFYGEPLEGLQLLGLLETRALDFDTVIMISANEGLLPAGKSLNSFVPFDIRVECGLPVHTEKEAVFAYHFYRLLQHCPDIHYLYNTESDSLGGGEKSRFIEQLLHELPAFNPAISIKENILSLPLQADAASASIKVMKSEDTLKRLYEKALTGFAPSTINAYRSCSLRFYFKEIAGLAEADEITETVDAATLGTVIHKVLEELFKPFVGKTLPASAVKEMAGHYYEMLSGEFASAYTGGDMTGGKNLLILKVAALYLQNFINAQLQETLDLEKKGLHLKINGLEQKLMVEMPVIAAGRELKVLLKGTIDRIDQIGGDIRIIDYKSGKVNAKDLTLEDWELLSDEAKLDKCLQLLMYSWLYYKQAENIVSIPAIISFRNISSWAINVKLPDDEPLNKEALDRFEVILLDILAQIFDPSIPFTQTDKPENCTYCPYISICNR